MLLSTSPAGSSRIPLLCSNPTTRLHPLLQTPHPFLSSGPKRSTQFWKPRSQSPLHHQVSLPAPDPDPDPTSAEEEKEEDGQPLPFSAAALAAAIRLASPASPVEFSQRVEKKQQQKGMVLPSPDFQKLCVEQLALFRMVVHRDAVLSVYVRPAGSYVMDQLELRRITFYPGGVSESEDCIILVGNFAIAAGLRAAEAVLSKQQVGFISEYGALVLPMVKHPFVVGFLVAEIPKVDMETHKTARSDEQHLPFSSSKNGAYGLPPSTNKRERGIQVFKEDLDKTCGQFTPEQRSRAIMISRSLATAYVMDQKAMLLQQSSWQNNVRMSHLVEQIRSPLSSIRALSKMLSVHVKRSEISYDIIEDMLVQGDHMRDALQQLQDAVFLTKANIVQYNEDALKKIHDSTLSHPESFRSLLPDHHVREPQNYNAQKMDPFLSLDSGQRDHEMPMPPLFLAPLQQQNIRPCTVSDILKDLVGAAVPLASKQQRLLELSELQSHPLLVAVEESALRQALSNLIEGALLRTQIGGKVQICAAAAPAGGAIIVIDDDGPDMHYMTQMHSLTPFGSDLFSDGRVEDNMAWNFVAGLAVAREILESYGCVVRVISPRLPDAAVGVGGTRIELWLPSLQPDPLVEPSMEA